MSDEIGILDKRIEIQSKTSTADGMFGSNEAWSKYCDAWAAIWPVNAKEVVQANSLTMIATHRIRVRYRSGIEASQRVKFGSRYFSIASIVNPQESNTWLDMICKEAS